MSDIVHFSLSLSRNLLEVLSVPHIILHSQLLWVCKDNNPMAKHVSQKKKQFSLLTEQETVYDYESTMVFKPNSRNKRT